MNVARHTPQHDPLVSRLFFIIMMGVGICLIAIVYNTVPFHMIPTMGQALWLGGFAESMSFGPFIQLSADEIGGPGTHIPAFGYTGALPMSWLIELGISMPHAYTLVFATYIALAGWAAYALASRFGAGPLPALLYAMCWLLLPVNWAHVDYSMLSIGFAFLPAYLLCALSLFDLQTPSPAVSVKFGLLATFAVFTDGYTFMMFASMFGIIFLFVFFTEPDRRQLLILRTLPLAALGFGTAFVLYSLIAGSGGFPKSSLDFFRGWGADLTYLIQPIQGEIWLFDRLGLSANRPPETHYGDRSVSYGSFLLPLLIISLTVAAFYRTRSVLPYLLIALAGIYMSFGPSFKVAQTKTPSQSVSLTAEQAGLPTGTGLVSAHLPGFQSMRASYRWSGMGQVGLWCILVLCLSGGRSRHSLQIIAPGLVILGSLPDLNQRADWGLKKLDMITAMDQDLHFLEEKLAGQERVLFYPHFNDFGANYLAPDNKFSTYNIGGDKNYALAQSQWPDTIRAAAIGSDPGPVLKTAFAAGDISAVVVPKFDLLMGVHTWPPIANRTNIALGVRQAFANDAQFSLFENRFAVIIKPTSAIKSDAQETRFETIAPLRFDLSGPPFYSQTGQLTETGLISSQTPGFALFGPYIALPAGQYRLVMDDVKIDGPPPRIDIVSSKGRAIHIAPSEHNIDVEGHIRIDFTLWDKVTDLEIRAFVREGHSLQISRIRISSL